MEHLTLIIPAKNEKESLPKVLNELKKYNLKIIIVLEKEDLDTINSIKEYDCKILYQKNKGYGDALLNGIQNVKTNFFCIFNADGSFNPIELKNRINGGFKFIAFSLDIRILDSVLNKSLSEIRKQ